MNKTPFDTQNLNPLEIAKLLSDAKTETAAKAIAMMFGLEYKTETKSEYNKSIDKFLETIDDINGKQVKEIYNLYLDFCKENNYTPKSQRGFSRYINREKNCKVENIYFNGKVCGFFVDINNPAELPKSHKAIDKTVLEFIESNYFFKYSNSHDYNNQVNVFVYQVYCIFCNEKDYTPTNKISFGQNFTAITRYKVVPRRVCGIIRRVYIKAE